MVHHCDLPPADTSFYDVYKCPLCKQWWLNKYGNYWVRRTRLRLIFAGYNNQCRSFLRHNKKEPRQ